jgi:YesN/AraC family two-component response regulator
MPYFRFFSETSTPLSRLNYIFQENPESRELVRETVREIYKEWTTKKEGYEIAVNILIKRILLTLLRSDTRKLLSCKDSAELIRLKPVFDYVERNLDGKIHVEDASRAANISYYYFVKYFKKAVGMSFMDYVNMKKIKKAEKILLTKDISVAQVGEQIGMPNMAHFYKIFRKFNRCSPHEFRKKMQEWGK